MGGRSIRVLYERALDGFILTYLRMSVAYIGPKSKTERRRKTKICTEVAHVTRGLCCLVCLSYLSMLGALTLMVG